MIHQERCDPSRGGYYLFSDALDVNVVYLANSAGVDFERAATRARLFAEIL